MNRYKALFTLLIFSFAATAQQLETSNDFLQSVNLGTRLKSIFQEIHKDFEKGKITAYVNDSFTSIMTKERYEKDFIGAADKENMFAGWGATVVPLSDFSSLEQKRTIIAFSPQYQLNIDGQDIGTFSHYTLKASDVEARLEEEDFKMLVTLLNLAEQMAANNPVVNTSFVFENGEILLDSLPYPKSPKLDEWTHGYKNLLLLQKDLEPIIDAVSNTLIENLNDALAANEPNLPCYLDKKLSEKIDHYGRYKPFAKEMKTYRENPKMAGNYIDSTVVVWPKLDDLEEISINKGVAELKMTERTIYMAEGDLRKVMPTWMMYVLMKD